MHFQYASQYLRRSSCTAWFSSLLFSSDTNAEFHLGGLWPNCELSYVTFFAESTSKAFRARSRSTCGFNQFDHEIVQTTRSQMAGDVSNKHRRNPMSSNQCQTYVNFRISMRMLRNMFAFSSNLQLRSRPAADARSGTRNTMDLG